MTSVPIVYDTDCDSNLMKNPILQKCGMPHFLKTNFLLHTEQRFIITENMMDSLYGSDNAKYDQHAKHLLASRKLLAEIVKKMVPEFQDASIDDIAEKYIEGNAACGKHPCSPGPYEYSAFQNLRWPQ